MVLEAARSHRTVEIVVAVDPHYHHTLAVLQLQLRWESAGRMGCCSADCAVVHLEIGRSSLGSTSWITLIAG